MKKVIVSGANGFIGRNLIKYLLVRKIEVIAIDMNWNKSKLTDMSGLTPITCTLNEMKSLPEFIPASDYDVFYHLAWAGSTGKGRADYSLQSMNAIAVCDAALASKKIGCKKFITPGTITEHVAEGLIENHYSSENLMYALSKIYAHNLLDIIATKNNINYVWTRFTNIFGGDSKNGNLISYTLTEFDADRIPTYGPCLQPYNFTYIKDVLKALYAIGESENTGNEYFISNGDCRKLKDYLETIADMCGKKVAIGERTDDGVKYLPEWFSNKALVDDLNFTPDYTFEDGVREIIEEKQQRK